MATIERYDMSDAGAADDGPDADGEPMTEAEEAAIRADLDAERADLARHRAHEAAHAADLAYTAGDDEVAVLGILSYPRWSVDVVTVACLMDPADASIAAKRPRADAALATLVRRGAVERYDHCGAAYYRAR